MSHFDHWIGQSALISWPLQKNLRVWNAFGIKRVFTFFHTNLAAKHKPSRDQLLFRSSEVLNTIPAMVILNPWKGRCKENHFFMTTIHAVCLACRGGGGTDVGLKRFSTPSLNPKHFEETDLINCCISSQSRSGEREAGKRGYLWINLSCLSAVTTVSFCNCNLQFDLSPAASGDSLL